MLIGYTRVSRSDQNPQLQQDALAAVGCGECFTDTASGAKSERPGLRAALGACRAGDTLVVWKLDRLGRSLTHLVETIQSLARQARGRLSELAGATGYDDLGWQADLPDLRIAGRV